MTPLHQACRCGCRPDITRTVLRSDPTAAYDRDRSGSPPLFYAQDAETAALLLEVAPLSVAVANARVAWLPLHAVAHDPDRGAVLAALLIDAGRRSGLRAGGAAEIDVCGRTPLDLVCRSVEIRSERGGDVVVPLEAPLDARHRDEWVKLEVILRAAYEDFCAGARDDDSVDDEEGLTLPSPSSPSSSAGVGSLPSCTRPWRCFHTTTRQLLSTPCVSIRTRHRGATVWDGRHFISSPPPPRPW